jgi:hypothetical protein
MALSTFLRADPFVGDPFGDFDPFRLIRALGPDIGDRTGSQLSDDARAIANTKVDWIGQDMCTNPALPFSKSFAFPMLFWSEASHMQYSRMYGGWCDSEGFV